MPNEQKKRSLPYFSRWFSSKTALVTGATSGLGREITKELTRYGCRVLPCGREEQAMNSLLEELNMISSSSIEGFFVDLSSHQSLEELVAKVNQSYHIDILVNNAGFGYMQDFYSMEQEKILAMEEVNISAVLRLSHAFLPKMIKRAMGGILNIGSTASFFPTPGSGLYGATKHFIVGFTDALHQEMKRFGVHVTGVYPDRIQTRFLERATEGRMKYWKKAQAPALVALAALKGLSENKIRVVPGWEAKAKVSLARLIPVSLLLKKSYQHKLKKRP